MRPLCRRKVKVHAQYRDLVRAAERRGWVLVRGGKHLKLRAPDGYVTPVPTSDEPGLYRTWRKRLLSHPSFDDSSSTPAGVETEVIQ